MCESNIDSVFELSNVVKDIAETLKNIRKEKVIDE